MDLFDAPANRPERWTLSRPMAASRLRVRAMTRLELVRRHFPELDSVTVRVGRTKSRRARAWASLDPAFPAIWIKPGALPLFTAAHELTHLLQALNMVPRGEKSADLFALARHPELIDKPPTYIKVPHLLFGLDGTPRRGTPEILHQAANRAIAESNGRWRRAIRLFEEYAAMSALPKTLRLFERIGQFFS
ncbi:MAG: hypothetical protein FD129_2942 [bacterium]|nr:MAG: hypothetical protein FD129_2942 [bacterium]